MLDVNLIRKDPDMVRDLLSRKGFEVDFSEYLEKDRARRDLIFRTEQLKAEKNKVSALVPVLRKGGRDVSDTLARMRQVADDIRDGEAQMAALDAWIRDFLDALPNLPDPSLPAGGKENNRVVRVFGTAPVFDFPPLHHVDLAESLGVVDYPRGARLGGSGHWVYRRDGARLEWALLNYFIEAHLADGYEFMLPPHLLTWACGYTAGQFPKFRDDVYQLRSDDTPDGFTHFILPTAETALVNLHRDEILDEEVLPLRYCAYTPCYRKEAGSYRSEERGMIRGHQFNKIEMFQYVRPEDADAALEELVGKAERLVQGLGLHHRVSRLAAGDCSAAMRRTYDIEVWIPSMNDFKEVSSASDAGDYQARRGNIRFRRKETGKPEFVHTLNASGLATSRIFPAILECNQDASGRVRIPEVLRKWMGGQEFLARPS